METKGGTRQTTPRRLRVAGLVLGAGFLLILVGVAGLAFMDLGRFRETIVAVASHALGRKVSIDGPLSIDLGRIIRIRAEGLRLADAEWADDEPMLSVGELAIACRASSLLFGPTYFENISLRDADLRLTQNERGQKNWRFVPKDGARPEPDQGAIVPAVMVEWMSVRNARLSVSSPDLEAPLHIGVDAIDQRIEGNRLLGGIQASVGDVPFSFESTLEPRQNLRLGRPVALEFSGKLGSVELVGRSVFDDLFDWNRPTIDVHVKGPTVEYLLDVLHLPPATRGPLDLRIALASGADRLDLSAVGDVGEFALRAQGWLSDLRRAERMDLKVHVKGPDLSYLGPVAGIQGLPPAPFDASGRVEKSAGGITLDGLRLRVGDAKFQLDGSVPGFPSFAGAELYAYAQGNDLAPFRTLLRVPHTPPGAFELRARTLGETGVGGRLSLDATVGDISTQAIVDLGKADDWIGTRAEFEVRGPDLSVVRAEPIIDGLPSLPFRVTGAAQYVGDRIRVEDVTTVLDETHVQFRGEVDLDWPGSNTDLRVGFETPNIRQILTAFGVGGAPGLPVQARTHLTLSDGWIHATELEVLLGEATLEGSIGVGLEPLGSSLRFDVSASAGNLAELLPSIPNFRPSEVPVQMQLRGAFDDNRLEFHDTSVRVGDARFEVTGVIDRPPRLDATNLRIEAEGPSLAQLGSSDQVHLPDLPFSLFGEFEGSPNTATGRGIQASAGDSALAIDVVYRDGSVPTIEISAESESLDLRPFLRPKRGDREQAPPDGRVIPDFAIPVELLGRVNGTADVSVGKMTTHAFVYRQVRLRGALSRGALRVDDLRALGRRAQWSAKGSYAPTPERQYALQTQVLGTEIRFAPADEPMGRFLARPTFDLDLDVTGEGTTLRGLFATLNGTVTLRGGGGVIPDRGTWLSRLFSSDFLMEVLDTVNPFAKQSDEVAVKCVVLLLDLENGRATGDPALVVQTNDVNIVAAGRLDLHTEDIRLIFRTQARRGLGLSLGAVNPFTKVSGTLAAPNLSIDKKGVLRDGGLAFATGGLSVLAKSLHGRFLSAKDPCGEALEDYRKVHGRPRVGDQARQ